MKWWCVSPSILSVLHSVSTGLSDMKISVPVSFLIHILLLWCMTSSPTAFGKKADKLALLAFKGGITQDPLHVMSSWNDSVPFCRWTGVACRRSDHRVVGLSLVGQDLEGSLSPTIGNLTSLAVLDLGQNRFHGELPQELGRLRRLQYLNLSVNSFEGEIPINLTHCSDLRYIELAVNQLIGKIPDQLSSLAKLEYLGLAVNNFTGEIPPWIGNFSSLSVLSLASNNLHGRIPDNIGHLSHLEYFQVGDNRLSGTVPPSLYNLSSLSMLAMTSNLLRGRLPPNIGFTLPNLQIIAGGVNNFEGPIPVSLSNLSSLQFLDFAQNRLTGSVPLQLGRLQSLTRLNFENNRLGSKKAGDLNIISALSNCTSLEVLSLAFNWLGGEVPHSIGNLSAQLTTLTLAGNFIHGSIPTAIENLVSLASLGLQLNLLTGSIPSGLGKLKNLQRLNLNGNMLSGPIPSSIGDLNRLFSLNMDDNNLEGRIPPSLGKCQSLNGLSLSGNKLKGTIPKQVIRLSSISDYFDLSHNSLSGSLPLEVGDMINVQRFDVSDNKLSGEIPSSLANCIMLDVLSMNGNFFEGIVPHSLIALRGIQRIDLSRNQLSGQIPEFLMNLKALKYLNLSHNSFTGRVPEKGIFENASAISLSGNKQQLCGGISELKLPECPKQRRPKSHKLVASLITVGILSVLLLFFGAFCWIRILRKKKATLTSEDFQTPMSYLELFKLTNGFSLDCLIGEGSFGSVYKTAAQDDKEIVAVKVLNLQQEGASKSFIAECEVLKNIRHRNLVKIITACSSVTSKGDDFKALVMEFMPNGSLEQWLYPSLSGENRLKCLSFVQRLNIAIDVASAVEYLHYHCHTPIAHCDLKPSNVLLDKDMTAHVGDFGLAKFLFQTTDKISAGLRGSIGYVPPEYGTGGQVSTFGDVYSYGILLLEMFTGKRPTADMFNDGQSLYNFIMMALPDRIMDIVDPRIFIEVKEEEEEEEASIIEEEIRRSNSNVGSKTKECLIAVITIGLSCSTPLPKDRIEMKEVLRTMRVVRDKFLTI